MGTGVTTWDFSQLIVELLIGVWFQLQILNYYLCADKIKKDIW